MLDRATKISSASKTLNVVYYPSRNTENVTVEVEVRVHGCKITYTYVYYEFILVLRFNHDTLTFILLATEMISLEAVPWIWRLVTRFPSQRLGFDARLCNMGFVVDKVALEREFSESFSFPCKFLFQQLLHICQSSCYRCYVF
jgi:hypothetical protein